MSQYPERLVLRVNELVYDYSASDYHRDVQSEMGRTEAERWKRLWQRNRPESPAEICELGTGTGFLPMAIGPLLSGEDHLVCTDVSREALSIARQQIESAGFSAEVDFRHLSTEAPFRLPFENDSFDAIVMNSVLHHISDLDGLRAELRRILRNGGLVFLGHEPNARFRNNRMLKSIFHLARGFFLPREAAIVFLRWIGIYNLVFSLKQRLRPAGEESVVAYVNRHLAQEGVWEESLSAQEIAFITDIRDEEGFDPDHPLPGLEPIEVETYNHLLTIDMNLSADDRVRRISRRLAGRWPLDGGTFSGVYRAGA